MESMDAHLAIFRLSYQQTIGSSMAWAYWDDWELKRLAELAAELCETEDRVAYAAKIAALTAAHEQRYGEEVQQKAQEAAKCAHRAMLAAEAGDWESAADWTASAYYLEMLCTKVRRMRFCSAESLCPRLHHEPRNGGAPIYRPLHLVARAALEAKLGLA